VLDRYVVGLPLPSNVSATFWLSALKLFAAPVKLVGLPAASYVELCEYPASRVDDSPVSQLGAVYRQIGQPTRWNKKLAGMHPHDVR